jgi:hypothetical protein
VVVIVNVRWMIRTQSRRRMLDISQRTAIDREGSCEEFLLCVGFERMIGVSKEFSSPF